MKKIIAILLSIMLAFGVATSAFAIVDTTDSTGITITATKPTDSSFENEEIPSTTIPVEEELTTGVPSTIDQEIPDAEKELSILDRIYNAIMNFIKEIIQIIDDSCDKLIDFIDRHSN